jgi:hypothetical protein
MRQAQAVLLPLELLLSQEETARAIGRSVNATCNMRMRFLAVSEDRRTAPRSKRELRNRAGATLERETKILDEVLSGAADGAVLVVPQFKPKIEARLDKPLVLSSVYRMLARHGWRKLVPGTRHRDGDAQAREDWKKELSHALVHLMAGFEHHRPLRLMFKDEVRFGRTSDCHRCWCRRPHRPLVKKMLSRQYVYAFGAVSPQDGMFDALVLPQADRPCTQSLVNEVARQHADDNIVTVLDGAGWHTRNELRAPANMWLTFLPPYSPELDPVEHMWDELRAKHFHKRLFDSPDAVEDHLVPSLRELEIEPQRAHSITAWQWMIDAASNAQRHQAVSGLVTSSPAPTSYFMGSPGWHCPLESETVLRTDGRGRESGLRSVGLRRASSHPARQRQRLLAFQKAAFTVHRDLVDAAAQRLHARPVGALSGTQSLGQLVAKQHLPHRGFDQRRDCLSLRRRRLRAQRGLGQRVAALVQQHQP